MGHAESNKACPKCGLTHSFEWVERSQTGWCINCGYFEYYPNYQAFLEDSDDDNTITGC